MKKKVLFIMPSMFIGGAERSLLGLLDAFDYSKYDVSLFLYRHEGEFYKYIPEKVNLLPAIEEYATFDVPIKDLLTSKLWQFGAARIIGKLKLKIKGAKTHNNYGVWASMQYISMSLQNLLPNIPGEYDLAVSFLGIPDVLLNKVTAKKKIAWNHTDYTILGADADYDRYVYSNVDAIVSVSDECTEQFKKTYPEFEGKAITIGNILSKELIERQAAEKIDDLIKVNGEICLLSIGRFSDAKNFDNVPDICKRIREQGINAMWYLIGYGSDEALIKAKIAEAEMQDFVVILGKKSNPYPYIKACDLYVQPSRYEGKCVSVIEAQILHKPVVITNYATSSSQFVDGYDGVIVPLDNKKCAEGIAELIKRPNVQEEMISNTFKVDYTNAAEIGKLYAMMESVS